MTAIIVIGVFAAAIIGLGTVFGGPIVGLILGVAAIVGAFVWFLALGSSRTTPGEVTRERTSKSFWAPAVPTTRPSTPGRRPKPGEARLRRLTPLAAGAGARGACPCLMHCAARRSRPPLPAAPQTC